MNNSETWVSHTPSSATHSHDDPEDLLEEDFASAAEPTTSTTTTYPRPPSPPNTFEKFFLPFETTGVDTSTFALAASRIYPIHTQTPTNGSTPTSRKLLSTRSTSPSIVTDDFASATEDISETSDLLDDISLEDPGHKSNLFNDILGKQTILEEEEHDDDTTVEIPEEFIEDPETMTSTIEPTPAAPVTMEPTEETSPEFDVVENVYEGAKSVWAFGKGIIVFSPFMGVAEGAATKVLSLTTGIASLEDADKHIKSTLSGVDKEFIDPAILKLWSVLEPIIGKGDEVLKGVLGVVSKKVPMLESESTEPTTTATTPVVVSKKESEEAVAPETSTPAVIA
jgi:hypothetical protein